MSFCMCDSFYERRSYSMMMSPFWMFLFLCIAATAAFPDRKRGLTELSTICAGAAIIDSSALIDDLVSPHFPKVVESERSQLFDSAFVENSNMTTIGGYNYFIYKHDGNKIVGGSNTKLPRLMVARRITQGVIVGLCHDDSCLDKCGNKVDEVAKQLEDVRD